MTKYYQSPRISNEILDCSMPMTFDTYSNCSYGCTYCFSQFRRVFAPCAKDYLSKKVNAVNVEKVKQLFLSQGEGTCFAPFIRNKIVMQWGGLADQFDGYEKKYGHTLELLKFFKSIEYPISFSTKSTWFLKDKRYLDVIDGTADYWHFKISIITLDEEKARIIEKGVKSPEERIENFRILSAMGNKSTLRLRPFIIGISTPSYLDLIQKSIDAGIYSISTEFLCFDARSYKKLKGEYDEISRIAGFDLYDFYKKNSAGQGFFRLNHDTKRPYMDKMAALCNKHGIQIGVSDAHLKTCGNMGSCCGLPNDWNYFRGQLTEAIMEAKKCDGQLSFDKMEPYIDLFKEFGFPNKNGLPTGFGYNWRSNKEIVQFKNFNFKDIIKEKWNTPNNKNSPANYTNGQLKPVAVKDGNTVYKIVK